MVGFGIQIGYRRVDFGIGLQRWHACGSPDGDKSKIRQVACQVHANWSRVLSVMLRSTELLSVSGKDIRLDCSRVPSVLSHKFGHLGSDLVGEKCLSVYSQFYGRTGSRSTGLVKGGVLVYLINVAWPVLPLHV